MPIDNKLVQIEQFHLFQIHSPKGNSSDLKNNQKTK